MQIACRPTYPDANLGQPFSQATYPVAYAAVTQFGERGPSPLTLTCMAPLNAAMLRLGNIGTSKIRHFAP